jgi:uncharacterized protein
MSEMIDNNEKRQEALRELIMELHNGKTVEEVKEKFAKLIEGISASEISMMERRLIEGGMPVEEIQRLCDVHAAVFEGSVAEIHSEELSSDNQTGHPIHTFKRENKQLVSLINEKIMPHIRDVDRKESEKRDLLIKNFEALLEVDKHYSRKENLVFPFMEKYGYTAPPKVMWGVDDEIRSDIKALLDKLRSGEALREEIFVKAEQAVNHVLEMVKKEENILFPMILDAFTAEDWQAIEISSEEIGFTLINPPRRWKVESPSEDADQASGATPDDRKIEPASEVPFDAGSMTPAQVNALLNTLPLDVTFVDKNGRVKYFSQGKDRIFVRPKTVLGREVRNCHPPASVHIVEKIVSDLESGRKDHVDFWIRMGERFVYIRYYAVRDEKGEFLGTLEVTQDIKEITELKGEKRLLTEE